MQSCPTCIMKHFKAYLNFIFIRLPIVFYIFSCLRKNFFAFYFVLTDILRQILRTLEKFRQNANGMWKEDSRKFLRKRKLTTHKKKSSTTLKNSVESSQLAFKVRSKGTFFMNLRKEIEGTKVTPDKVSPYAPF